MRLATAFQSFCVRCKWTCFADLKDNPPNLFKEALCFYLSTEWTSLAVWSIRSYLTANC